MGLLVFWDLMKRDNDLEGRRLGREVTLLEDEVKAFAQPVKCDLPRMPSIAELSRSPHSSSSIAADDDRDARKA
jgi:hypothetical protein